MTGSENAPRRILGLDPGLNHTGWGIVEIRGSALVRYSARVAACVRQFIEIEVPSTVVRGQYQAIYKVKLLPTGEQLPNSLERVQPSGRDAYDLAIERAIRRCNPFPRPDTGEAVPSDLTLSFDPIEDRK